MTQAFIPHDDTKLAELTAPNWTYTNVSREAEVTKFAEQYVAVLKTMIDNRAEPKDLVDNCNRIGGRFQSMPDGKGKDLAILFGETLMEVVYVESPRIGDALNFSPLIGFSCSV